MHVRRQAFHPLAVGLVLLLAIPVAAQQEKSGKKAKSSEKDKTAVTVNLPAVLWNDPGDIASLDLVYGIGGKENAPRNDDSYKFIKEDLNGTSPKFYIEDSKGVEWLVKLGPEAKPETAATRLIWAMGYFTDADYYVPLIHVTGIPHLHRGSHEVSADGTVTHVRLKRKNKGEKKIGNWKWFDNPFLHTRELDGLRVMMALISNWDLKTVNNKIYNENDTEQRYVVSDVGASFGKTGGASSRSKGNLKDYRDSKFIDHAGSDVVDLEMASRPFPLLAPFNPGNFEKRIEIEEVAKHISRVNAQWIGQQLSRLTQDQIRDAFRAAGYSPEDGEEYTQAVVARIAQLSAL